MCVLSPLDQQIAAAQRVGMGVEGQQQQAGCDPFHGVTPMVCHAFVVHPPASAKQIQKVIRNSG
jgi:hypothetical protein